MSARAVVRARRATLSVDGHERNLLEVAPADTGAHPTRLLLAVHGSNQSGRGFRRFTGGTLDDWAATGEGITVYPDSWRRSLWNDARSGARSRARTEGVDDVAFLRAIIDRYRADGVTEVFAIGYSNGGQLLIRVAHETPELLGGVGLVGATMPARDALLPLRTDGPTVPTLLIHGTRDPLVPYDGGMASLFGFRPRGLMRSFDESVAYWIGRAGITAEPTSEVMGGVASSGTRPARTTTVRRLYTQEGRPTVAAYSVRGGGHVVPNRAESAPRILGPSATFDTATVLTDFFDAHRTTAQD